MAAGNRNDRRATTRAAVFAARAIRFASRCVPAADRASWLRQWQAELIHRQGRADTGATSAFELARWSLGSLRHALWLRGRQVGPSRLLLDLGYAARALRRRPALSGSAVLTLAVGIGATTSLFSVVNGALLRPLPYPEPDRLAMVFQTNRAWMESPNPLFASIGAQFPVSYLMYEEWVAQEEVFEAVASLRSAAHTIHRDGAAERVFGAAVAGDLPAVLGIEPAMGRWFLPEEDEPGAPRLVVLSHSFWRDYFGADAAIVGRSLLLSDREHLVVGVAPSNFDVPRQAAFWTNMPDEDRAGRWQDAGLEVIARLTSDRDMETAQAMLEAHTTSLAASNDSLADFGVRLISPLEHEIGPGRGSFLLLLGAAALLLLIACANVASLLLVRGSERRHEVAVRAALGAGRGRLVRQFLAESTLLALIGGALGATFAYLATGRLVEFLPQQMRARPVAVDETVLLFAVAVAVLAGLVVGLISCVDVIRDAPARCLAAASTRTTGSRGQQRALSTVVVAQVALAVVLLIGATLLLTSLQRLLAVDRGFDEDAITSFSIALPEGSYDESAAIVAFVDQVVEKLRGLPGVESAAIIDSLPFAAGTSTTTFHVEGAAPTEDEFAYSAIVKSSSPAYMSELAIPVRAGRGFGTADIADGEAVMLINEATAASFFPGQDPLGQRMRRSDTDPWARVVGVVGNVLHFSLREEPPAIVYRPFAQAPGRFFRIALRGLGDGDVAMVRRAVASVDARVPIESIDMLSDLVRADTARPRARTILVALAAGLALVLAMIGVYGAIAYAVRQRKREIGIRMALGARSADVVGDVLRWGLGLAGAGVVLGVGGALAMGRLLSSFLYGVTPSDPATLVIAGLTLLLIAAAACGWPALSAARTDPASVLRAD